MNSRVSKDDWCVTGLEVLRTRGHAALTLEAICDALGKTKGSFYHHFADFDGYLVAVLSKWKAELTERPIARGDDSATFDEFLIADFDHALDRAVRAWAVSDSRVRAAVDDVDERRIDHLTRKHRTAGHNDSRTLGELEYAMFLGAQELGVFADAKRARKLAKVATTALILYGSPFARKSAAR